MSYLPLLEQDQRDATIQGQKLELDQLNSELHQLKMPKAFESTVRAVETPKPISPTSPTVVQPKSHPLFTKSDPTRKGFSDLPGEIRNQIYALTLLSAKPLDMDSVEHDLATETYTRPNTVNAALLLVSSQLSVEASDIFFGNNKFVVNVPTTRSLPSPILRHTENVTIRIKYKNINTVVTDRVVHAIQLEYLMECAKILAHNENLQSLHIQLSEYSTAPINRDTIRQLIWPFLLFLKGVKNITFGRRRFCPDFTWHEAKDRDVLPPDMREVFLKRCGVEKEEDINTRRTQRTREEKLAGEMQMELDQGWLEDFKEVLELDKQWKLGCGKIEVWKGWEKSIKQKL
jgi:hypothetical protein